MSDLISYECKMIFLIYLLTTLVDATWVSPVPYIIDDQVNQEKIEIAIKYIEIYTNWEFIPRTNQKDYIYFNHSNNGCSAQVGFGRGGQKLSFIDDSCTIGTIIHEISHILGLPHQHQYSNRNNYIRINFENINEKKINNFVILNTTFSLLNNYPYDFESIMHYSLWAFTRNGKQTIQILENSLNLKICSIGSFNELSDIDIQKLNKLCFNCTEKSKEKNKNQLRFCGKNLNLQIYGRYKDNKQVWGDHRIRYRWSLFSKNRWEIYKRHYIYDIVRAYSYDGKKWYVNEEIEESLKFNKEIEKSYGINILSLCFEILVIIIFIIVLLSLKFIFYN